MDRRGGQSSGLAGEHELGEAIDRAQSLAADLLVLDLHPELLLDAEDQLERVDRVETEPLRSEQRLGVSDRLGSAVELQAIDQDLLDAELDLGGGDGTHGARDGITAHAGAAANIGGAFAVLNMENGAFLFFLNFGTGVLFLLFYYLSRFRKAFEYLYWPFVLLIVCFLFINALENAGSQGGAHYYFIPALVIAIILSNKISRTAIAIALFCGAALVLLIVEQVHPDWITAHANKQERFIDIAGNLLFVQVFMGTVLNQTGQAIEVVVITMGVYLTISLVTSFIMNIYNRRVAIVER